MDKNTHKTIGVCYIKLKDFKDQIRTEETIKLKEQSGSEIVGWLRLRVRVLWSKLNYFQQQIIVAENKLEMANNESNTIGNHLKLLNEPFGIIIYGEIENIIDEDILEIPKEKEEMLVKQRKSVLPSSRNLIKTDNTHVFASYADKLDSAVRLTFSNYFIKFYNIFF